MSQTSPWPSWISPLCLRLKKLRRPSATLDSAALEAGGRGAELVVSNDVRASFHEDGIAILNLSTGKVFLSNETGSRIWRGLVAGLSPDAIGEELSREFGVAREVIHRHTSGFLNDLEQRGLVIRKAAN